ncbi:MAG: AraC family transcriptional regulator [Leptolyngbyaceae cyanobacterium MO_188.B28]|nr:AraC family transcriptional regulator [Leptolyngbyaceae cyanobacterium MO_188.B28]
MAPKNQNYLAQPEWHLTQQWGQLGIRHCRHTCRYESGEDKWTFKDEHTLGVFLSPHPFRFSHRQENRPYAGFYRKGDLLITPADTTLFTQAGGDVQIVQLRIQASFVRQVAEETLSQNGDRVELIQAFQTRDPQIEAIAMMLLAELHQTSFSSQLYVDSLANVLAVHLLRRHATTRSQPPLCKGGLGQRQLMLVLEYIDAHLNHEITLADLSQLLDLSQFHFGRLFKQSLGLSPYQYLLQQRVERAKQLLKQTDKSIMDIAFECGFNSHSHLSKQFRQQTGMTPTTYRAS